MKSQEESHLSIQFSENIDQELGKLSAEMRVANILRTMANGGELLQSDVANIRHMLLVINDLFSSSLPPLEDDPMEMLKLASRDIKLSTLLRERGLARLYMLTNLQVQVFDKITRQNLLVPAFMSQDNPDTGQRFRTQEEFLGWFCKNAKVPRALVFTRMSTYDRLQTLGMTVSEAFDVILQKPFAARKALKEVAEWDGELLVGMDPEVAMRLARTMLPEHVEEINVLAEAYQNADTFQEQQDAREDLLDAIKPAIRKMVEEVAAHESVRDVMDMVTHDLAGKPEIKYWYDQGHGWFKVEYDEKARDARGNLYTKKVHEIHLVPELPLPQEVTEDIARKLGVKNRTLDFK